jgi:DNA uptake protein ComE-like DNA-binding protein
MFTFTWIELVTDALLDQIIELAGDATHPPRDQLREALARVLRNAGGLPVVEATLSEAQKTERGERLFADALGHYLSASGIMPDQSGHYLTASDTPALDACIASMGVVDVNRASQQHLESLPRVGAANARAILRARRASGYFASLDELIDRVDGLGPGAAQVLRHVTRFDVPVGAPPAAESAGTRLSHSLRYTLDGFAAAEPGSRLLRLMEAILAVTSRSPHPDTVQQRPRSLNALALEPQVEAGVVGLLEGAAYYERLPEFLRAAGASIKVAMFHAALPGPNHPTKLLLDELIAAKARGVDVRVILDRDRETDPYMSTVINANAKRYLEDHGVECRFDTEDVLLHSKYVILDTQMCVLGSHNWSAGSYSEFDDLSFVVQSPEIAAALVTRFEQLWK